MGLGALSARPFAPIRQETHMNHVYKNLEVTGTSPISSDEAVRIAIAKASRTVRNMDWFQVMETRGVMAADKIADPHIRHDQDRTGVVRVLDRSAIL